MASYDSYQGDYGSSNYGGGGYRDSGGGMGGGGGGFGGGGYGGAGYGGAGYGGAGYGGATPFGGAGATPPVVRGLLILNVVVFLLQLIVGKFTSFDYMKYFALNSEYAIGRLWIWQFFTSIFLHSPTGIFHILFNMLMLWMFGREVEARLGSKRFLQFYLGAGAFASLCFAIVAVLGAKFALAVGASGAIFGVMVLFAYLYPEATLLAFFVIPVKAKHLVMFLIAMDLVYFVFMSDSSQVAHSAHLGGALFGFLASGCSCRTWRRASGARPRRASAMLGHASIACSTRSRPASRSRPRSGSSSTRRARSTTRSDPADLAGSSAWDGGCSRGRPCARRPSFACS